MPAELPEELESRYPLECCVCGAALSVAPSISMQFGINTGHGTCLRCQTFLHLEIAEGGGFMVSEPWDDYAAREQGSKSSAT